MPIICPSFIPGCPGHDSAPPGSSPGGSILGTVGKIPLYPITVLSAAAGAIPWSGVPEVWSQIWNNSLSAVGANALSGKLTDAQAQVIRDQQSSQLRQAGASPEEVAAADRALLNYINTPVSKGGAGGTVSGLPAAIGSAASDLTSSIGKTFLRVLPDSGGGWLKLVAVSAGVFAVSLLIHEAIS